MNNREWAEMMQALEQDGAKLRALTGEDHGPWDLQSTPTSTLGNPPMNDNPEPAPQVASAANPPECPPLPALLPCPFCQSANVALARSGAYAECSDCGAEGPSGEVDWDAVSLWNARLPMVPVAGTEPARLTGLPGFKAGFDAGWTAAGLEAEVDAHIAGSVPSNGIIERAVNTLLAAPAPDLEGDVLDGILFRFWIHAASAFPGATARAIAHCLTPADYRRELLELARRERVNLPEPSNPRSPE